MKFCLIKNEENKFLGDEIDYIYYGTWTGGSLEYERGYFNLKDCLYPSSYEPIKLAIFTSEEAALEYIDGKDNLSVVKITDLEEYKDLTHLDASC